MNGNNMLEENIYDFIEQRLDETYNNLIENNNYKKLEILYNELFNDIKESIKDITIIEKYEKSRNDMYDIQTKEAYKTGFNDAVTIFFNNIQLL